MVVGWYVLHVTCDSEGHHEPKEDRDEFTGASKADARRAARAAGWYLSPRGDTALCPRHARKMV
jgi:hypothetical protein